MSAARVAGACGDANPPGGHFLPMMRGYFRLAFQSRAAGNASCRFFHVAKQSNTSRTLCSRACLRNGINDRRVEPARFRFELFPIDRDLQGVGVEIINRRPDLGQHPPPGAGVVALRPKESGKAHRPRSRHGVRLESQDAGAGVIGLGPCGTHA